MKLEDYKNKAEDYKMQSKNNKMFDVQKAYSLKV
jgi:hypothetical protein